MYKYIRSYSPFNYGDKYGGAHGEASEFSLNFAKEKKND
jgi:hypothetical protein